MVRRAARAIPIALAIAIVVLAYAFFATHGTLNFGQFRDTEISFYVQLRQGFSAGHLYMDFPVDAKIAGLPNPYDAKAREGVFYAWDSSYFNGHYYLYHSALPVLLAYLPLEVVSRRDVPDQLVAPLFCIWAFIAILLFVSQGLTDRPRVPFFIWALFLGLGNAIPFVLSSSRFYEVAIMTGMAMTATWAVSVQRLLRAPSTARAVWMGVWLALAIAARPDLLVLGAAAATALVIAFRREPKRLVRAACGFAVPMAIVGAAILWYNAARFDNPLEFGVRYQLTTIDMAGKRLCGVRSMAEAMRAVNSAWHYVFLAPVARGTFPFLEAQVAKLDPAVSWPTPGNGTEQVIGVAPLLPLVMIGTALAFFFAFAWRGALDARVRAAIIVMAGAWIVLAGLSTCWWIVARYSLDFVMLMAGASIVLTEHALGMLPRTFLPRLFLAALAVYSVVVGLLLGFGGPVGAFKGANPALIRRLGG